MEAHACFYIEVHFISIGSKSSDLIHMKSKAADMAKLGFAVMTSFSDHQKVVDAKSLKIDAVVDHVSTLSSTFVLYASPRQQTRAPP
jgi:hypothetical protein